MKKVICLLFSILFSNYAATELNAQAAGSYWQQEVNYTIDVALDDVNHFLNGHISIEYINHSPDTLYFIWFHLWPNAYKNTSTAYAKQELNNNNTEFQFSSDADKGYIDLLNFKVGGEPVNVKDDPVNIDITQLQLTQPLLPGRSILITTPFRVKIPKTFSRLGHNGQSYQITQWYPKPAVYDRYGWHPIPYLDQGEFYSEFGTFDVAITLPENYVVGATGVLKNPEENKWLDSLASSTRKKFESIEINTNNPFSEAWGKNAGDQKFPASSFQTKTLRYAADQVHDFAWFADKRYQVMKSAVHLQGKTTSITTWAMFLNQHTAQWKNAIRFVDSSVTYYSKWVGDYPYPQATAVEGALQAGDGMEYPMITVVSGGFGSNKTLETVIAHEVGHNWFYGILGFNERMHPWMDEGINSYYENRYIESRYPDDGLASGVNPLSKAFDLTSYSRNYQNYLIYIFQAHRQLDQPMDINAADFTSLNYGAIVYAKTALVFKYLEAYLGIVACDSLMQQFFKQWQFKHPYPADLEEFFETHTKKELDWLFRQTIETKEYFDYKMVKTGDTVTIGNSTFQKLIVKNKASIKGPISISALKNGREVNTLWLGGFNGKMSVIFPYGNYDAFRIDEKMELPEVNTKNNMVRTSGLLPNLEKFRLQWLGSADNPERTQLFFTPTAGWNNYDKFWLGLALYNSVLPGKPLSFVMMPAYGFGSNSFIGLAEVNLQLFPKVPFIQRLDLTSSAKSFDYANDSFYGSEGNAVYRFAKFTQQALLVFRKKMARSQIDQSISFRNIYLLKQLPQNYPGTQSPADQMINELSYVIQSKSVLHPFGIAVKLEQGTAEAKDFYLKTFLEGNYTINYPRKKHGVYLRSFAGLMIASPEDGSFADFHLSPTTGTKDYHFDEVYLGRTESAGFFSQQVAIGDGGFKMRTDGVQPGLGNSDSWLLALNAKVSLPFFSAIFAFGDAGLAPSDGTYREFQFDGGIGITLIPNIAEVYIPLLFSNDMKLHLNTTVFYDQWYKRISFTLNISRMNPFKAIKTVSL